VQLKQAETAGSYIGKWGALMERFLTVWRFISFIGGVLFTLSVALFVVRCGATGNLLSLEQFGHYMDGLVKYILK
jgi:hypothetical protein